MRGSGRRGRKVAARWTAGVVDAVGHHPSVLAWHHRALDQFTRRGLAVADIDLWLCGLSAEHRRGARTYLHVTQHDGRCRQHTHEIGRAHV